MNSYIEARCFNQACKHEFNWLRGTALRCPRCGYSFQARYTPTTKVLPSSEQNKPSLVIVYRNDAKGLEHEAR
jgi:DNA-directed RNA polymerase subunit RPC12/RpoP